ncbi:MAG: hypoxanthine phosphoribosyltransferase [Peptostreptococcaceae bacterium]|nr:hypoxanthine phosphoribosyltransferase [Peptostreptococcaceae bacterium]
MNAQRLNISKVMISEEQIKKRVVEMAGQIEADYAGKNLIVVGVLKGASVFVSDLIRHIDLPLTLDFMAVSSYGMSTESSGVVRILKDLDMDISGMDVLVVEDIIDSGLTLSYLQDYLSARHVNSLRLCTLLDKPHRRKTEIKADYIGFTIEDEFIVGYGIDCKEEYRNLPYIAAVE